MITYELGQWQSTIDLMMASDSLKQRLTLCQCHPTEHGADHRAIEATFADPAQLTPPTRELNKPPRYQWKKAPWDEITKQLHQTRTSVPEIQDATELERQLRPLMNKVSGAIKAWVPHVRPSP
ncbi:hypothetical protein BDV29DRAFT_181005 [Aspergillus leporis]|uniref:Endonuclease/exonuclease/phosphatase domain-containing protein n=1 Tax=Aspergillus leporis TaxID=41062 RepID=A0A5N5WP88_9EURO|nr:hypothetical protein BDV29DRAFT_181005 [Aspergillus leporis]